MTADTELARLEDAGAEARARVRVGAIVLAASVAAFALSWAFLGKAIMMAVVLAFSAGGTVGGAGLILDGSLRGVRVSREMRARRQLPAARIIGASRRREP